MLHIVVKKKKLKNIKTNKLFYIIFKKNNLWLFYSYFKLNTGYYF